MPTSKTEIRGLLHQWRGLVGASRPQWPGVDLTFTQLRALSALGRRGSLRVSELAETFGIGLAAASALADRMARRGLITRRPDPDDRRIVRLELSPRGRQLLERMERVSTERFERLVGHMTPAEREALATALRAFVRLSREHVLEKREHGIVAVRRVG